MVISEPGSDPLAFDKRNRQLAMAAASVLLFASAILMAMVKRGLVDDTARGPCELAGLTLGCCGFLYLVYSWCPDRLNFTIGQLMKLVAIAALALVAFVMGRRL
jgi:hypothetical protein